MSKVRVYELAKEAGLKSKELADKLIAMGYPIASHSSSIDDDMAADIRKKLKGEAVTGTAEGRIELKTRTESAATKATTVIRRRSKAEKDETAKKVEEAEALVFEAETLVFEAQLKEQAQAAKAQQEQEEIARDVAKDAGTPTAAEPIDQEEMVVATASLAKEPTTAIDLKEVPEAITAIDQPSGDELKKPRQLARIVGRVVIPVPEKRAAKPVAKRPPARPPKPAAGDSPAVVPAVKDETGRVDAKGKKKAK